ncbi:MAG: hypothetical protein K2N11_04145 [Mucispirillum sp.]|nr:hypothetical protein [Mucispirillum sp.]
MLRNSSKEIPGTNGEMTEHDLFLLLSQLAEKGHSDCFDSIPVTERGINTLVMIKQGTKEELIEENRKLYEAKAWEQYL